MNQSSGKEGDGIEANAAKPPTPIGSGTVGAATRTVQNRVCLRRMEVLSGIEIVSPNGSCFQAIREAAVHEHGDNAVPHREDAEPQATSWLRAPFFVQPVVQTADVEPESDEVPDREETVPVRKDSQGIVAPSKQHVRVNNYGSIEMEDQQPVADFVPQILEGDAVGKYDESHTGIPSDDDDDPIDRVGHLFDRKVVNEPKDMDDGPTDVWQQGDTSKGLVVECFQTQPIRDPPGYGLTIARIRFAELAPQSAFLVAEDEDVKEDRHRQQKKEQAKIAI